MVTSTDLRGGGGGDVFWSGVVMLSGWCRFVLFIRYVGVDISPLALDEARRRTSGGKGGKGGKGGQGGRASGDCTYRFLEGDMSDPTLPDQIAAQVRLMEAARAAPQNSLSAPPPPPPRPQQPKKHGGGKPSPAVATAGRPTPAAATVSSEGSGGASAGGASSKGAMFDVVACQFALHYSCGDAALVGHLLSNVAWALKPGGVLIATLVDSRALLHYRGSLGHASAAPPVGERSEHNPGGGGGGGGGDEEKENRPTIGEPLDEPLDEPTGRAPGCGPNGGDHTGRSGGGVLHRAAATGEGGRPLKDPCLKSPGQGRPVRLPPSLLDVAARTEADRQRRDDAEVTLPTRPDPARVDTNTDLLPPL